MKRTKKNKKEAGFGLLKNTNLKGFLPMNALLDRVEAEQSREDWSFLTTGYGNLKCCITKAQILFEIRNYLSLEARLTILFFNLRPFTAMKNFQVE